MRRTVYGIALVLVLWAGRMPVVASSTEGEEGDKKFHITGEVRARWEYFENLTDFTDNADSADIDDDTYDIWPYRVRIAAHGQFSEGVSAMIELQNFGVFGDETPFKSSGYPPFQSFEAGSDPDDTNLYQGYLQLSEIGGSSTNARIGRQEHTLGNELHMGDSDFYNGLSYDGVRLWWDFESWELDGFYYNMSENNEGCLSFCGSDNVDFFGVTANFMAGENIEIEPYVLNFRSQTPIDATFQDKANFFTFGGRATRAIDSREDLEDGRWDWNAEIALQDGDIGPSFAESSHSAWLAEGWLGYNWACGDNGRSRVYAGLLMSSGDPEDAGGLPDDGDHENFLFLFTDFHSNNRLGDSDLEEIFFSAAAADAAFVAFFSSGVTDYNFGYEYVGERHGLLAAYHLFSLTEENCVGLTCDDDLGQELDIRYTYAYSSQLGFEVGVADFMPGDAVLNTFGGDDDALRIWGQARLRF